MPAKTTQAGIPCTTALQVVVEVAPVFEGAEYARITPGEYSAQCVHAKVYFDPGFRTWKALLRFRLMDDREEVYGFFNLGRDAKPNAGRRSRYWQAWTMANGGAPRKRQTMTPRVFRGGLFRVEVADVVRSGGKQHHPTAVYSTVKRIIEKEG